MVFTNWIKGSLASDDVIDSYFVISDLKDMPISQSETAVSNELDSRASKVKINPKDPRPVGKQVY